MQREHWSEKRERASERWKDGRNRDPLTVGDEDVTSPSGDHVSVEQGGHRSPEGGSFLESSDPEVKGEHE